MGGLRVSLREPVENKRRRRKILDSGLLCGGNGAARARKRLENKEAGEISPFFRWR
ncbi:MAG: hypothetical protein WA651_12925 [Candidatus Sulfotelmatobacter sp.]